VAILPCQVGDRLVSLLQRILNLLDGVHATANGYQARCPAHDDRTPSLSLAKGDDGRVLLHCHAGCSAEAITSVIGIRMHDLFQRSDRKGGGGGGISIPKTLRTFEQLLENSQTQEIPTVRITLQRIPWIRTLK
jgi:hypothetical protein